MANQPAQPRWYFSLRSPYSWFAYRDLVDRYPDVAERMEWIPFWEPDEHSQRLLDGADVTLPIVPMSRAKNFYILQDSRRLARARGLEMSWPIDRNPNWEIAHLGYLLAERHGRGRDYIDLVYRARWQQGRDITSRTTIGEIGAELGLPAERMSRAADDPEIRGWGVECLIRSYRDGLFGVPFFVIGRDRYFGVDRLRPVVAALRGTVLPDEADQAWLGDLIELPELVRAGGDAGHAGGCG